MSYHVLIEAKDINECTIHVSLPEIIAFVVSLSNSKWSQTSKTTENHSCHTVGENRVL